MSFNLFFGGVGGQEILLIMLLALLFFGGKKLPELMRGMGRGIREFNNARHNIEGEIREGMREADIKKVEEKRAAEESKA